MTLKIQVLTAAIALAMAQGAVAQKSPEPNNTAQSSSPSSTGSSSGGKSTTAGSGQGNKPQLMISSVDHTRAMDGLLQAAQKMRESIQALAQQPAGPKRSAAMEAARHSLLDTQQAMLELPADLRVESKERKAATDWPKAMARLDKAAEKLRESVDAMSKQQSGKRPDKAIASTREALEEAQKAMMALPDYSS